MVSGNATCSRVTLIVRKTFSSHFANTERRRRAFQFRKRRVGSGIWPYSLYSPIAIAWFSAYSLMTSPSWVQCGRGSGDLQVLNSVAIVLSDYGTEFISI